MSTIFTMITVCEINQEKKTTKNLTLADFLDSSFVEVVRLDDVVESLAGGAGASLAGGAGDSLASDAGASMTRDAGGCVDASGDGDSVAAPTLTSEAGAFSATTVFVSCLLSTSVVGAGNK